MPTSPPPPDDPFAPNDATILRPRPGRRPGPLPAGSTPAGAGAAGAQSLPPPPPMRHAPNSGPDVEEFISKGRNPLIQGAVPLLVLAGRLRGQIANADVESVRRQCVQEIRGFEDRVRQANVPSEDVLAARYALCTAIDEAVLNTPWGAQSSWASQSLLVTFHREAQGGEKFFQILDRLLTEPQRYLGVLELYYACLAVGFEGRYRLDERGAQRLADIRRELFQRLESARGGFEPELSPHWKGVEDRRNGVVRLIPLWVVAAACVLVLVGAYIWLNTRLNTRATPVNAALGNIGLERFQAPPQLGAPSSGLAQFLAPQISRGVVAVNEQGDRTLITITVPGLFASGSARVDARYDALVHEIGAALNKVPGRIIVTGHTDDQPVRSFQYHDNYELSRARAQTVAQLLKQDVQDGGRIDSAGKGDSDPLYKPADAPENRARNRRVEIVHRRDL